MNVLLSGSLTDSLTVAASTDLFDFTIVDSDFYGIVYIIMCEQKQNQTFIIFNMINLQFDTDNWHLQFKYHILYMTDSRVAMIIIMFIIMYVSCLQYSINW